MLLNLSDRIRDSNAQINMMIETATEQLKGMRVLLASLCAASLLVLGSHVH